MRQLSQVEYRELVRELLEVCRWALACMKNEHTSLTEELKRVLKKCEGI
jgi:hypothetical protein